MRRKELINGWNSKGMILLHSKKVIIKKGERSLTSIDSNAQN